VVLYTEKLHGFVLILRQYFYSLSVVSNLIATHLTLMYAVVCVLPTYFITYFTALSRSKPFLHATGDRTKPHSFNMEFAATLHTLENQRTLCSNTTACNK
jgi:hypothetical protein